MHYIYIYNSKRNNENILPLAKHKPTYKEVNGTFRAVYMYEYEAIHAVYVCRYINIICKCMSTKAHK